MDTIVNPKFKKPAPGTQYQQGISSLQRQNAKISFKGIELNPQIELL